MTPAPARRPRRTRTPLYRFAVGDGPDQTVYTAEGEYRGSARDGAEITVYLHLGYPREAVLGFTTTRCEPGESVEAAVMRAARRMLLHPPATARATMPHN